MPKVVLLKRKDSETQQDTVKKALNHLTLNEQIKSSDTVLVDLNLLLDESYEYGNITSPETCEAIVDFLINELKVTPENIWVGDGGYSSSTPGAIKRLKLPEMAEEYGFNVIDLNYDERIDNVKPDDALALQSVNIAKTAMDVDVIISVPSLKTHSMAVTTLSIKNLMGTLQPKGHMHSNLHKKLADLLSIFHPRTKLAVIDGFIGSDGMEEGGHPVKMDVIVAGTDFVAVDTVGSALIGYSPNECKYLKYSAEMGLGTSDLSKIEVIGDSLKALKRKFRR